MTAHQTVSPNFFSVSSKAKISCFFRCIQRFTGFEMKPKIQIFLLLLLLSIRLNYSNSGITRECVQRKSTQLTQIFSIFLMPAARNLTKDFLLLNRQGPLEKKRKRGKQMDMCRSDLVHNASLAHSLTPFSFSFPETCHHLLSLLCSPARQQPPGTN